jgi:single-strand DNA-binding protein
MEAVSVGHDLARGRGRFFRNKPTAASATETAEADGQVRGETARPVAEGEAPAVYGDGVLDGDEPTFEDAPAPPPDGFDAVAAMRSGTIEPFDTAMVVPAGAETDEPERDPAVAPDPTPAPESDPGDAPDPGEAPVPGPDSRSGAGTRSDRRAEPGSAAVDPGAEQPAAGAEAPTRRPTRSRSTRRQPVPA